MNIVKLGTALKKIYGNRILNNYVGANRNLLISFIDYYYANRHFILLFKPNGDVVIEESLEKSINTLYAHYLITDNNPGSIDKAFDNDIFDIIINIRKAYTRSHGITPNP